MYIKKKKDQSELIIDKGCNLVTVGRKKRFDGRETRKSSAFTARRAQVETERHSQTR